MCNRLHEDGTSIPTEGIGYKMFYADDKGTYGQWNCVGRGYYVDDNGRTVKWNNKKYAWEPKLGFCFFATKKQARKALAFFNYDYDDTAVSFLKIKYRGGIGQCFEERFGTNLMLCKEFTLVNTKCKITSRP